MERRAIPDAPLDSTHVTATDVRLVCQGFLREATLPAEVSETASEPLQGGMLGGLTGLAWHATDAGASRPFRPRPIGYNDHWHVVQHMLYIRAMPRLKQTAFRIEPETLQALDDIKRRDGLPISEQVRRALQAWIESRGIMKTAPRRAVTRRRA
jgi:hypothetical protein